MKKTWIKLSIIVIVLLLAFTTYLRANNSNDNLTKEKVLSQLLLYSLANLHYSPVKINDQFSVTTFNLYIKNLDPAKKFFYQSDIDNLTRYQKRIDDELQAGTFEFLNAATGILQQRVEEVQGFYTELLNQPFDFNSDESFELDPEKRTYSRGKNEFKELWRELLKYQTLTAYLQIAQDNVDAKKIKAIPEKTDTKMEAEARKKVAQDIKRVLNRILQDTREEHLERYFDNVTAAFDPHTTYYAPEATEQFNIDMTGTLEGIGALLQEQTGGDYIRVEKVIPGSPAWRQKELKEGDIIIKVAEGNGEPVDIANMRITDAVKLIRGKKGTTVRLTVKKPNGQINVIAITRDVVIIEDSYAKSALIEDKKLGKTFGYISLPSFYHDFNNQKARNSADDIRKELDKLNRKKVSGIILDLRNNGGGALEDAVKMTGLFINDGPVVQVRERNGKTEILKDEDPVAVYKGPLVVLINSLSASASEILAAALQDYGRAVIIGINSFGKGTVQSVIDLDKVITDNYSFAKPLGSIKVTIQKFYRINGGSTQYKGVAADVVLPDQLSYYDIGEKELANYLPYDTIKPASYKSWSNKLNLAKIRTQSKLRLKENEVFKQISLNTAQLKLQKNRTLQTLNLKKLLAEQSKFKQQTDRLAKNQVNKDYLKIWSTSSEQKTDNDEWFQQLGKDEYIDESLNVLNDIAAQK
jgi:carboxyl-terminal processing protease